MHDLGIALLSRFFSFWSESSFHTVCSKEMNDFSLVMTGRPTLFIFKANWTHDSPIAAPENELN